METLKLTLRKKWFDMILSGEKLEEYREIKPHWAPTFSPFNRKTWKAATKDCLHAVKECGALYNYDFVEFTNGYGHHRPWIRLKCKGIEIREGKPEWGADPGVEYFVIELGAILSTDNLLEDQYEAAIKRGRGEVRIVRRAKQ